MVSTSQSFLFLEGLHRGGITRIQTHRHNAWFCSPCHPSWECLAYAFHPRALDFYMTTVWMLLHCQKKHEALMWSIPSSVFSVLLVFIHMCPWVLFNLFLEHLNSHVCQVPPYSKFLHFGLFHWPFFAFVTSPWLIMFNHLFNSLWAINSLKANWTRRWPNPSCGSSTQYL